MLLGTLVSSLLTDMHLNKKVKGVIRAGEGTIRAGCGFKNFLLPHPLTNFEMQAYYQNEHRFNGVYS